MKNILFGISEANSHLLGKKKIDAALNSCITSIGEAIEIDRSYIFRNHVEEGILKLHYEYEWCNVNIEPYLGNPDLSGYTYDSFPGLLDIFLTDKCVYGLVSEIQNDFFREIMEMQSIKAFLFAPIFCNNFFWGWIGFDDCVEDRIWKAEEAEAIHSVARNIGLRLQNEQTITELKDALFEMDFYIRSSYQAKWEWNIETGSVKYSYNWFGMLGYKQNEIPENFETWRKLVHPDDLEIIENKLNSYLNNKSNEYQGVARLKHKKGHYVWVNFSGLAYRDDNNLIKKIIGTHIDISALKEKEAELTKQRNEYNHLVNNVTEIIFKTDKSGKISFLNSQWNKITGFQSSNCIGQDITNFFHADDASKINQYFKLNINKVISAEVRMKKRDNSYIWTLLILSKRKDFENTSELIIGSITNIDDKIFFKKQHELSKEKFRFIAENTSDLICQNNLMGHFTYISKSSIEITGYSDSDLLGKNPLDLVHPDDQSKIRTTFKFINEKKSTKIFECRYRNKNNQYIWMETIAKPIKNEKGDVIGFQSSSRNISERIKAEEEIKISLNKERELNELKSGFVSMASHQFRTPLTVIYSNVELLEFKYKSLDNSIENNFLIITNRIKNEVDRMTELMNNILIFGKYGNGHIKLDLKSIQITELIKSTVENYFNFKSGQKKIKIEVFGLTREIETDETLMIHILTNIIGNAIKYSSKSPTPPKVVINFESSHFTISVIDYGIGIPKKDITNLFQSFYRGSNTSTFTGSGLGLVISKQFIEILNGTIHIESQPNKKTTIAIKLPYEQK